MSSSLMRRFASWKHAHGSRPVISATCWRDGVPPRWRSTRLLAPGGEPGATSRLCERQLRALGVNIFLTPSDPERFAGPFYDWVRVGSRAFDVAAAVGYPLQNDPGVVRGCALEVFPHASDVFLRGCLPPVHTTRRVGRKRAWRLATLEAAGVNTSDLCVNRVGAPTLDSIDAALAAITALRAVDGEFSVFGSAGEWIVVPETTPAALVPGLAASRYRSVKSSFARQAVR